MFNLQRCSAIIFALLILVPSAYSQIQNNEINPEYVKCIQGKQETITRYGHRLGYIPPPYKIHTELPANLKKQLTKKESLPASFDLRTTGGLTSVKNQGNCGACWTFATMGAIESRWKVTGRGTYDLSEDYLNTCHSPFVYAPCAGGNSYMSLACLARGSGPISESDDPYSDAHTTINCPSGLNPQGIITSGWFIPTTDPSIIKNLIQTYGALYTCFYYDDAYYNSTNYTYYYSGSAAANHAVTLVGWDDNKVTAGGTGVWIIKNSWGTSWGESGFFYISYNDSKINSELALFEDYINYDPNQTISTYSESGWVGNNIGYGTSLAHALVKFVASGNVKLTKIGTYVNYPGAIVSIDIYDNFNGSNSLTGLLGSISAQTCTYTGYYTFDFSSPINLSTVNDYYVKISYQTAGYNYPIPIEAANSGYNTPTFETGKCWISSDGSSWTSLESCGSYDLCAYAFTTVPLLVKAKVFLQGPYSSTAMTTALNTGALIPLNSNTAYNTTTYGYTNKTVAAIPNANIVDWVLVELRSGTAASTKVETQAAFLLKDGTVVDVDGSSDVAFSIATTGSYYIVIRHRNHLAVMSAAAVSLPNASVYDFTSAQTQAYGTTPMVAVTTGVYGMWCGDTDASETIDATDRANTWNNRNTSGYTGNDTDLSGVVDATDRANTWNNRNALTNVPN